MKVRITEAMDMLWGFAKTLSVALVGMVVARKLKIPVANMLGPMFAVAIYNVFTNDVHLSSNVRIFTQIINGAFIGAGIQMADVLILRKMTPAVIVNVVGMLSFGLLLGVSFTFISDYDLATTAFACAPGGLTDMPLISHDYGADVGAVALLQLSRVLVAMAILPFVLRKVLKYMKIEENKKGEIRRVKPPFNGKNFALTMLIGAFGGGIGFLLGIPAGALMIAMVLCAIFNMATGRGYMPIGVKTFAQLMAGTLIGSSVTMESVIQMRTLLVPILVMAVAVILLDLGLSWIFIKVFHIDAQTALFANAPGGLTDMALMATEYGANMATVVMFQTMRMCGTILLYPWLVMILM